MTKRILYRCWYSGKETTLAELKRVDKQLAKMDSETIEDLYDLLPKSERPRKQPYVHVPDNLGYPILNLCPEIFEKYQKKL